MRRTAPEYSRAANGTRRTVEPTRTINDSTICHPGAAPKTIRTGIASAEEVGRIDAITCKRPFGSSSAPIEMKNETRIVRLIGTITFCSSSIRVTSDPAAANNVA